jgi:geranylgeranyl pyrophosphate synthase
VADPGPLERTAIDASLAALADAVPSVVPDQVRAAMRYALSSEGKRVRGLLVLAAYRAGGGPRSADALPLALAVETIHAYSLVHDDLPCMDDDDLRRGRPTVHRAFDAPTATAAGILMIPLAVQTACRGAAALCLTTDRTCEIVRRLMVGAGAGGMVGGQLLDLEGERIALSLEALEELHRAKTGALIAAAAIIGGVAAGVGPAALEALETYGSDLGLAFQIVDDMLDLTASAEELGKSVRRDGPMGKSTHPALLGLEGSRLRAAALIDRACDALHSAGIHSAELDRLAQFTTSRTT